MQDATSQWQIKVELQDRLRKTYAYLAILCDLLGWLSDPFKGDS